MMPNTKCHRVTVNLTAADRKALEHIAGYFNVTSESEMLRAMIRATANLIRFLEGQNDDAQ